MPQLLTHSSAGGVHAQLLRALDEVAGEADRPLTQLVGVLPRCRHDSTLPWVQARTETGDASPGRASRCGGAGDRRTVERWRPRRRRGSAARSCRAAPTSRGSSAPRPYVPPTQEDGAGLEVDVDPCEWGCRGGHGLQRGALRGAGDAGGGRVEPGAAASLALPRSRHTAHVKTSRRPWGSVVVRRAGGRGNRRGRLVRRSRVPADVPG
jgi:hypothetical protein